MQNARARRKADSDLITKYIVDEFGSVDPRLFSEDGIPAGGGRSRAPEWGRASSPYWSKPDQYDKKGTLIVEDALLENSEEGRRLRAFRYVNGPVGVFTPTGGLGVVICLAVAVGWGCFRDFMFESDVSVVTLAVSSGDAANAGSTPGDPPSLQKALSSAQSVREPSTRILRAKCASRPYLIRHSRSAASVDLGGLHGRRGEHREQHREHGSCEFNAKRQQSKNRR